VLALNDARESNVWEHKQGGGPARTSMRGHVFWGVSARSTELLGYQALMEPSLRENREAVEGHSMA